MKVYLRLKRPLIIFAQNPNPHSALFLWLATLHLSPTFYQTPLYSARKAPSTVHSRAVTLPQPPQCTFSPPCPIDLHAPMVSLRPELIFQLIVSVLVVIGGLVFNGRMNAVPSHGDMAHWALAQLTDADMFLMQSVVTCGALFWYVILITKH